MKIKTQSLIGPALNWAVAKCQGKNITLMRNDDGSLFPQPVWADGLWQQCYSSSWAQGGPIIEREISELYEHKQLECWAAKSKAGNVRYGPTPLSAVMRCYVAGKFGDEVEVPDELMEI